jgi:hypothetical protein
MLAKSFLQGLACITARSEDSGQWGIIVVVQRYISETTETNAYNVLSKAFACIKARPEDSIQAWSA